MHLRRLPVTVAGHWLTPNCVTILQQGSFLLAPPWQGGWLRASDLDNLGKANAAFFLAFSIELAFVGTNIISNWYSTDWEVWYEGTGLQILMVLLLALVWGWARSALGQAVMFARNGRLVLRLVTSAAAGGTCRPEVDVDRLLVTMAWLPAYDRRDAMTIKDVLKDVERNVEASSEASEEASMSSTASAAFAGSPSLMHAAALSLFVHSWLVPSPGDPPAGTSVRSWLGGMGVIVKDGLHRSLLLGGRESHTEAAPRRWLDARLHSGEGEGEEGGEEKGDDQHDLAASSTEPSAFCGAHLIQYGWDLVRGVSDYAVTPVGIISLEKAMRPTDPIKLRFVRLRSAGVKHWLLVSLYWWAGVSVSSTVCYGVQAAYNKPWGGSEYGPMSIRPYVPYWVGGWARNMASTIKFAGFVVVVTVSVLLKVRTDLANRCFPLPLRPAGKLEYALLLAAYESARARAHSCSVSAVSLTPARPPCTRRSGLFPHTRAEAVEGAAGDSWEPRAEPGRAAAVHVLGGAVLPRVRGRLRFLWGGDSVYCVRVLHSDRECSCCRRAAPQPRVLV